MPKREIYVFADWQETEGAKLMGVLTSDNLRGKEIFSFEYSKSWLSSKFAQVLDPDLQLYAGPQYLNNNDKFNFGLFLDSAPDRWGKVLMQRREVARAQLEHRRVVKLFETDYLLGVHDSHRMGGLRFKLDLAGPFLNNDEHQASPPYASIRELQQISLKLEQDGVVDDSEYLRWLNMLINPGSSLGGARPKASILDADNHLWIAKFPSQNDQSDIGAWEMVTYELAILAGIEMSVCKAEKFSGSHHTFITKRFDRTAKGKRIHFTSAMTQLGYTDGTDAALGASYLEIVDFITSKGVNIKQDLHELWRRIVFNICVSNTDDHLRNHGFLLTPQGWKLSPAFDVNPNETGLGLKLNISENDNALNIDLTMEVHEFFRLNKIEAQKIVAQVKQAVNHWPKIATKYNISRAEQELKSPAFSAIN